MVNGAIRIEPEVIDGGEPGTRGVVSLSLPTNAACIYTLWLQLSGLAWLAYEPQ